MKYMNKNFFKLLESLILTCVIFAFISCTRVKNQGNDENNNGNDPIENVCEIISFDSATIDGEKISMFVEQNIDSVSLSGKIQVSKDCTWKLYSDKLGQHEIPTKVAASSSGELLDGNNQFYILVSSIQEDKIKVYELNIYKSFEVTISYYDNEQLLKTETVFTGIEFNITYKPQIKGYEFNYWKDNENKQINKICIYDDLNIYADKTAQNYKITLNVNGGEKLDSNILYIDYNETRQLPIPNQNGYSFEGWYLNTRKVTNEQGQLLLPWQFNYDTFLIAQYTPNIYTISAQSNYNDIKIVGSGEYSYKSSVTLSAYQNLGYKFLGWYENEKLVSAKSIYTFEMPYYSLNYIAKYEILDELKPYKFSSSLDTLTISGVYDKNIQEITLPNYVTSISDSSIENCINFEKIIFPVKIRAIPNNIFRNCTKLTIIEFEGKIQSIGRGAFYNCGIKNMELPASLLEIYPNAFNSCQDLMRITIPKSITNIGESAFENCVNLETVTWSGSESTVYSCSISANAFRNCTTLKNITLPNKITTLRTGIFENCSSLLYLNIENINRIEPRALKGCTSLQGIYWGTTADKWTDGVHSYWINQITIEWLINTKSENCWIRV